MTDQAAFTVVTKIRPGERDALDAVLRTVAADVERNELLPFGRFGNVHFARFVILDETKDVRGNVIRPSLAFASKIDAPLEAYLRELVTACGEGLDRIYQHCEAYPEAGRRDPRSRQDYLEAHAVPSQAFYVNTIGRTVRQVREESGLRNSLERFLDRECAGQAWAGWNARRAHEAVRSFVQSEPSLRWALTPAEGRDLGWRVREGLRFWLTVLLFVLGLPLFLLALPIFLLLLRRHENRDAREQRGLRLSQETRGELAIHEDQVVQNQFSAVGNIKPGWFRLLTLRAGLWAVNFANRHIYNNGDLGTVRLLGLSGVDTIHFAQWVLIDENRRLLFMSNYDGSLVSYMDDFINKVAWGLNGVFSNGVGYPKTNWLVLDGAEDEQAFKAFLQNRQILTQVWYTGYRDLTAVNLRNNTQIRNGLSAALSEPEAATWLRRL